jgi:hypothetical protein
MISFARHILKAIGCDEETADRIQAEMLTDGPIAWLELSQFNTRAETAATRLKIPINPKPINNERITNKTERPGGIFPGI